MNIDIIEKKIIKILEKISKKKLNKDEIRKINYFDEGLVDSLNLINFIFLIEEKFKVNFIKKEIYSSNFKKINKLALMIKKKISQNG